MVELSIALVVVAAMATYLANRYLDQRQQTLDHKSKINNEAADAAVTAAVTEMHKHFDTRINRTWETIQVTKQELESLKLAMAIKGK
jgi:C4-dicarboxylate transporter